MKLKVFAIPAQGDDATEAAVNQFLASHKIAQTDRTLIQNGAGSFWSICIGYWDAVPAVRGNGKQRIDYREVLSESDFRLYAKLREWRKAKADAESIPAFGVFTNEQLANIVTGKVVSVSALGKLDGIGKAKVERYGNELVNLLAGLLKPDGNDAGA